MHVQLAVSTLGRFLPFCLITIFEILSCVNSYKEEGKLKAGFHSYKFRN